MNENSGNIHEMNENSDTSEDDDYSEVFTLMCTTDHKYVNVNANDSSKTTKLKVNNTNINFIIDSGSSINVIDKNSFSKLNPDNKIKLQRSKQKMYLYGTTEPLSMSLYFDTALENKYIVVPARIHVVGNNDAGNLLGLETSKGLTLLKINLVNVKNMDKNKFINVANDLKAPCEKYACLTKGKGKFLNYRCKLRVDKNVPPKQQRLRQQP